MGERGRIALVTSLVVWVACVGTWLILLDHERSGVCPPFTPPPDSSAPYTGTGRWQWLPPGKRCEYRVQAPVGDPARPSVHVDGPPQARLGILGVLVLWPVSTITLAVAVHRDKDSPRPPSRLGS